MGKWSDFAEIDKMIVEGIKKLGGEVFVKLNWSAPLDATWASANQLKVSHPLHIWQLLKCSDRIQHDLEAPFRYASDREQTEVLQSAQSKHQPSIILKKYLTDIGGGEYRCFIKSGRLLAITQRDIRAFYNYMTTNLKQTGKILTLFISEKIIPLLYEHLELDSFVLDLSLKTMDFNGSSDFNDSNINIIDINPFSNCYCDSLLFDWENELMNENVRQFWGEHDLILDGVVQEKLYDWSGFCGFLRTRMKENFSPSQFLEGRMSKDLSFDNFKL